MRSIWNGSISFGLVSIPVKLYSTSESRKLDLEMLDRHDNALVLQVIRFADEIRGTKVLKLPKTKVAKKEVDMAVSLVDQYSTIGIVSLTGQY